MAEQTAEETTSGEPPIVIKKYANRRLYNTATSNFVTLDNLHEMVKSGERFVVKDAQSGTDITCSVLAQIIADEENRGHNMLPPNYLRQVLKLYNEGIGPQLSAYLEQSLESFAANQQQMLSQMARMFGGSEAMESWAEAGRRNMELFQQSMTMFARDPEGAARRDAAKPESKDEEVRALKLQMEELQKRLDTMSRDDKDKQ